MLTVVIVYSVLIAVAYLCGRRDGYDAQLFEETQKFAQRAKPPEIAVHFAPHGDCEKAVVAVINKAKRCVYLMAYFFTSPEIVDALTKARKRDVKVSMLTDVRGDDFPGLRALHDVGAEHWVDKKHPIMHNKVVIADDNVVVTGSYNFTERAENNAENLLVIRSEMVAGLFSENWIMHCAHAEKITQ